MFLSDGRPPEVDVLHHWAVVWFKLAGKWEKVSRPVDIRPSKTSLLNVSNRSRHSSDCFNPV